MKITKTHLAQIVKEELAATNLQEAPLPADEYDDTVEYLWSQNLSHIVLPFKHATNLDGEFPPAIKTIIDYWEKKDFKGMASEFISLRDELDEWLKSRGFNWSIRTEKDPGSRYVDYSIDGRKGRTSRSSIDTNFKQAFRLIRMLINNPPPNRGYTGFGVANSNPNFMRQQAIDADTLGHRQTQEGKNKMKITKTHLAQIIQEEVAKSIEEGMMDAIGAIKDKLSPKRPSPAKAPVPRERNKHEKKQWRQQGGADAYDFNLGMLERPNFPNDKDYMEGWNDSLQEGKNKIKITKSTLAQIVQEELTAMKAEGYGNYKRDDKKPRRGKKGLGEAEGRYEFELDPKVQQSVLQALANSGTGALDFPLPLTPEQEKYYSHLDDGDRQSMLRDVVEELVEGGEAFKDADGLYYAVQGLDEGGYDDEYDYGADERAEEEYFSQALWDAVDGALEDWNGTPAPKHEIITGAPEGIDELDWDEMGEKYLSSLIDDGTVELRQGAPGDDWNGEEELYVLALR